MGAPTSQKSYSVQTDYPSKSRETSSHYKEILALRNKGCIAQTPTSQKAYSPQADSLKNFCEMSSKSTDNMKSIVALTAKLQKNAKGKVSEKCKPVESFNENELLSFVYKCIGTDSEGKIKVMDLKKKSAKYPEVANFLGLNNYHKESTGFDEFLLKGKFSITQEELCKFVSVRGGINRKEMSLQTLRKLTCDVICDASQRGKQPIFLEKVDSADNGFTTLEQKSVDDFYCYFDRFMFMMNAAPAKTDKALLGRG